MTDRFWDTIFQCLRQGDWIFLASPPLETMSRARHKRPGPAPLRSEAWPSGFPWLTDDNKAKVDTANRLFDRCVEAASVCASAGGCFLLENPEDLGATKDGERPASFWQLSQVRDLQVQHTAMTFAYFRCSFGAPSAKPSRILCNSHLLYDTPPPYCVWPTFDAQGRYTGPLPPRCPHSHHPKPLVGRSGRVWISASSLDWPQALCEHVLHSILPSVLRTRGDSGENAPDTSGGADVPNLKTLASAAGRTSSLPAAPSNSGCPAASGLGSQVATGPAVPKVSSQVATGTAVHVGSQVATGPAVHVGSQVATGPDSSEAHAHEAERFASQLLSKGSSLSSADIVSLYDVLPKEVSARDPDGRIPSSFSTGAYNKGGLTGLRKAAHDFPMTTRCLARFVKNSWPQHTFSTLSVYDNVCTALHRDSRNASFDNLIIPLTEFGGGQLWLEDDSGTVPQTRGESEIWGTPIPIPRKGLRFNAREAFHCTMPWTGRRLILVAFTVSRTNDLQPHDAQLLQGLGFNMPGIDRELDELGSTADDLVSESAEPEFPSEGEAAGADDGFRPELCGNFGAPLTLTWDGRDSLMTDGYGLCSPTRWLPASRGTTLPQRAKDFSRRLNGLVQAFVLKEVPDCRKLAISLATGHVLNSPFSEESLNRFREEWASLVCNFEGAQHEGLLEVAPTQPFYLRLLSCTARLLEDPDWEILTEGNECFEKGVPLGYDEPIPRVPQVFDRKVKWRKLDESEFEAVQENYHSAKLTVQEMELKFREEEKLGRMYPTTFATLAAEHGRERVRIAAMGAVAKADGSVRPLHDGTHGVRINNSIRLVNQTATPGPAEVAHVVSSAKRSREAAFGITADVSAAHRLFKHRRKDHPLMACKADSDSTVVWVNTVGTFGLSVASFWWSRLFGLVGRTVARALLQEWFYQLCFVDDIHGVFTGQHKFRNLVMWFVLYLTLGTPFSFKKFRGGFKVPFVGFELDYSTWKVGMSDSRGAWIVSWIKDARSKRYVVQVRLFREFLGRLGFVSRIVVWIKPHLAPLYAWSSAVSKSTVAKLPETVILTLLYLEKTLDEFTFKVNPCRKPTHQVAGFRTDAKCADGFVVIAGWELSDDSQSSRWFSLRLLPDDAPYLFDDRGKSQWASGSAELLATLAALHIFGYLSASVDRKELDVECAADTDNQGNSRLLKKRSSTKWPLMLINMQLSDLLLRSSLELLLRWRPRDENQLADQLTNEVFTNFTVEHRLIIKYSDLPLSLLHQLWETKESFDAARRAQAALSSEAAQLQSRKRKTEKTPW